ncbi:hypothetical protein [Paenibacillus sp.]|uniref:hypothetical protein n=1 Tax=Paenibacillus sp. TaxID=58172 RepID=UPI002D2EA49C|nr:hypothetical protein [Paenibacillus sp.]HZG58047.1 hypothetical protein [Paenibacillus sp.]
MFGKRIAACALVFAILLTGGWFAEKAVRERRSAGIAAYRAIEEGIAIVRSTAYPAFRSREYVKIIRQMQRLDEEERSP